jgi:hypothetical protein
MRINRALSFVALAVTLLLLEPAHASKKGTFTTYTTVWNDISRTYIGQPGNGYLFTRNGWGQNRD